ncbi:MAG: hypothetical protein OHK0039_20370 [Bacteroidia bacterium]
MLKVDSLRAVWDDVTQPDSLRERAGFALYQAYIGPQPDTALWIAQERYALGLRMKSPKVQASASMTMGNYYLRQGAYDQTLVYYTQAAARFREAGVTKGEAGVGINMAIIYNRQGDYARAAQSLQRSLALYREAAYPDGEVIALSRLGVTAYYQGDYAQALDWYSQCIERSEKIGNQLYLAEGLNSRMLVHMEQGNYVLALEDASRCLPLFRAAGQAGEEAGTLINIGLIFGRQGDSEQAFDYYTQGVALARASGQHITAANGLVNLAGIDQARGALDAALEKLAEARSIYEKLGDQKNLASVLGSIGVLRAEQGRYAEAQTYFEQSLAINEQIETRVGLVEQLNNLGQLCLTLNKPAQAAAYYRRSLGLAQEMESLGDIVSAAMGLSESYRAGGQYRQALEQYRLAVEMRDSLDRSENQRATIRFEFQQQALQDSLAFVQAQAETSLTYNQQIAQRNYLIIAILGLLLSGLFAFMLFRNRQRIRQREQALILQQERTEQARLRQLDQLKNRFFTNITHEFRTPLTVIIGMAQILSGNYREKKLILRNGQNLLRLINQLLDLAKLEAGKLELRLTQVDVVGYVRYLTESFYSMAEEKEIRLTFYAELRELWMDIDEEKLQYIIFNLLSNALKFTPVGGKVILHLKQAEDRLEINVQDTGVGISPAQLPYIFDRFYQADDSQTRAYEGTGIGLAYTRELIHQLGGEVTVSSEVAAGSTFSLWIPIRREAPQGVPQAASLQPTMLDQTSFSPEAWGSDAQPLVLIVEDNPDLIFYLQSVLVNHYSLKIARNGAEGIAMALELIPDLIISDVIMPQKDGFELCETLKTDQRSSHIPIILLTARATQADKIEGLTRGADSYMAKPFDKEELLVRVEQLIALRRSLQQTYAQGQEQASADALQLPAQEHDFLQQLKQRLAPVLGEADFTIPQMAELMGMSQVQLYRKLKALTGQTPSLFLRRMRLDASKALLADPEKNIAEVAYEVGFSDPNYFSKTFHQAFGIPPGEFRKRL